MFRILSFVVMLLAINSMPPIFNGVKHLSHKRKSIAEKDINGEKDFEDETSDRDTANLFGEQIARFLNLTKQGNKKDAIAESFVAKHSSKQLDRKKYRRHPLANSYKPFVVDQRYEELNNWAATIDSDKNKSSTSKANEGGRRGRIRRQMNEEDSEFPSEQEAQFQEGNKTTRLRMGTASWILIVIIGVLCVMIMAIGLFICYLLLEDEAIDNYLLEGAPQDMVEEVAFYSQDMSKQEPVPGAGKEMLEPEIEEQSLPTEEPEPKRPAADENSLEEQLSSLMFNSSDNVKSSTT